MALTFAAENSDALRYCHDAGAWYQWLKTHWDPNRDGLALDLVRILVRRLNRGQDKKTRFSTGKAAFAASVERFAQRERALAVTSGDWDKDPYLLATPGGVVDLRTGELRPARRSDSKRPVTMRRSVRRPSLTCFA